MQRDSACHQQSWNLSKLFREDVYAVEAACAKTARRQFTYKYSMWRFRAALLRCSLSKSFGKFRRHLGIPQEGPMDPRYHVAVLREVRLLVI